MVALRWRIVMRPPVSARRLLPTCPAQAMPDNRLAEELLQMSEILDALPEIVELVHADLVRDTHPAIGRPGMSADQVLRALILKQMNGFSYDELEFHLADSLSYRAFCGFGEHDKPVKRSTLQENIKKLTPETLESINRALIAYANRTGIESGSRVRVDATGVESNIHPPTDSSLLYDVIRTLLRLMKKGRRLGVDCRSHKKRAKRLAYRIFNAKDAVVRRALYEELLLLAEDGLGQAVAAIELLHAEGGARAGRLAAELAHFVELGRAVVQQTSRRVLHGETVPATEKVVSIFEEHTDILVKGQRDLVYGHKVYVTSGSSSLVLDCVIEDGNPADSALTSRMIARQVALYGAPPRQTAFDGAFASKENVKQLKNLGVEDVVFTKGCGLDRSEMVSELWVYRLLQHFRAGIEATISFLKRCFGLDRCLWRGKISFKVYVWSSVVAANLLLLARRQLGTA